MRHIIRSGALALVSVFAHRAGAQSASGLLSDATVLPSRAIRFGAFTAFTRSDELFGGGATRNLASSFATDSLGARQVPFLTASEADIRAASALPNFRLSAGQLTAAANSRVVTAPVIIEYGVTHRLTLGVAVPLVETRTTLIAQLNPRLGFANVGLNPAVGDNGASALAQNGALVLSLRAAADTLQRRLTLCQTTPTNPICAPLNGAQSAAQTLIQNTTAFAAALERLYGTSTGAHPGDPFVPLASDASHVAVTHQIASLAQQYQAFLNANVVNGSVVGAAAPAARDQLQAIVGAFGHDSIQVADRSSIGDISVGATYQLANTFGDTSEAAASRMHYRLALNGTFRIGTGQPANRNRFFDSGTGYGQPGVTGGIATDVQLTHRYSASAIGTYTHQLGTIDVNRVPNAGNAVFPFGAGVPGSYTAGDVLSLSVLPRVRLAGYFSLNGQYSMVRTAADQYTLLPVASGDTVTRVQPVVPYGAASSTIQAIGFGFSYSTVVGPDAAPGRIPFEVSFSHLEAIAGSGGPAAKTFRDQLELKVFLTR